MLNRMCNSSLVRSIAIALLMATGGAVVDADTFTVLDDQEQPSEVVGTLIASGQGVHLIAQPDGQYQVIAASRLQKREVGDDPTPLTPDEMADVLREQFGSDRIRVKVDAPYVVGLVLAGPLPDQSRNRVEGFLRKVTRFMHNVESVFSRFCRELRLDSPRPVAPQVVLVFETDRDFNAYARKVTGGQGLAAENMAGFYSPLSNWLAIRIGEFRSFQVPLHEAIHQQVYNRGLLQRLAGVPVWFNEGIATGFENDGERINIGPTKINATYARMVPRATTLSWQDVHTNDRTFVGDVLAGEAYVHAWSMHWLLVSQHRREYTKYFQRLGQIPPLATVTAREREQEFLDIFGKTVSELHADFPRLLEAGMKRQKISFNDSLSPPNMTHGDASQIELTSVQRNPAGILEVCGELQNVSPFREFAYYVTVQTDGGLYADWHLPRVDSLTTQTLSLKTVSKQMPGGPAEPGSQMWVEVVCALPDSEEAADWRRGIYPSLGWQP